MPLAIHPVNKNSVIVVDLMADPEPLLELPSAQVAERIFSRSEDLGEGVERIPIKEVHINRSPMLATSNLLDQAAQGRLQIDMARCEANWQKLNRVDLRSKLNDIFTLREFDEHTDPERMLYSGGFFSNEDRRLMNDVASASGEQLAERTFPFADNRLPELLFRYRARNFPHTLTAEEQSHWQEFCQLRRHSEDEGGLTVEQCLERISALRSEQDADKQTVLDALASYVKGLS